MSTKQGAVVENNQPRAEDYLARNYAWLPFTPVKAGGCWIWDNQGRAYLDLVACYSALNFGQTHPVLVQALQEQLNTGLALTPGFILPEDKKQLAKELSELCGFGEEGMALFMVTGAEAVETAMKAARKWAYLKKGVPENQAEIIFCKNNFHGRTTGIISASTVPQYRDYFGPYLPGIKIIPFGDDSALREAIAPNTAAIIVEPIQGEGGIIVPPEGYLRTIRAVCSGKNTLLIFDEVQTGIHRTGKFLACDWESVRPDLLILGKALGGGLVPLSAVVGKRSVLEVFLPGDHGSTFGGYPLACHVARAVLRLVQTSGFAEMVSETSRFLRKEWEKLQADYPLIIKEVRGKGMMIGVELQPYGPTGHEICEALLREGLIIKETRENVLRCSPPLIITKTEILWAFDKIRQVFNQFSCQQEGGCRCER